MTMVVILLLVAFVGVGLAAARFGADSRQLDPGRATPTWPGTPHRG